MGDEILELVSFEYDQETELVHVEAVLSDAWLSAPATLYDPEQWSAGLCSAQILWPSEFPPPTSSSLLEHLENSSPSWYFIPPCEVEV